MRLGNSLHSKIPDGEQRPGKGIGGALGLGQHRCGAGDVQDIEIGAAEGTHGRVLDRHVDEAVEPALWIDASDFAAMDEGAPIEALGIDSSAVAASLDVAGG